MASLCTHKACTPTPRHRFDEVRAAVPKLNLVGGWTTRTYRYYSGAQPTVQCPARSANALVDASSDGGSPGRHWCSS